MALAFDAASNGTNSATLNHTCTGTNLVLIVGVIGDITGDNLTGVTYAGVALTYITKLKATNDRWNYLYGLINPATGENLIAVSGLTYRQISGVSYTGCSQAAQPDSIGTAHQWAGAETSITLTTTVVAANSWMVGTMYAPGGYAGSGGSAIRVATDRGAIVFFDSNAALAAGSQSITATFTSNVCLGLIVSIAPVAAAGPANLKTWNGLAKASVKTINGLAIASVKTWNGLA